MAARYWVGGGSSALWSATAPTNWGTASGTQDNASVPGAADDIIFDGVGTGASNSTMTSLSCNSFDFLGYANVLNFNGATLTHVGNGTVARYSSGMSVTSSGINTFTGTSGTIPFTPNGLVLGQVIINCPGATVRLQGALSLTAGTGSRVTHTAGTFDDSGFAITVSATSGLGYVSSNTNVRAFLHSGTFTLTSISAGWNCSTSTNMTMTSTGRIIYTDTSASTAKTFQGGGLTYSGTVQTSGRLTLSGNNTIGTLTLNLATATSATTITGSNTIGTLNMNTAGVVAPVLWTSGTTQTLTGAMSTNGVPGNLVTLKAATGASAFTLSKASGQIDVYGVSIQDCTASGGATFFDRGGVNVSGNSGWGFLPFPTNLLAALGVG